VDVNLLIGSILVIQFDDLIYGKIFQLLRVFSSGQITTTLIYRNRLYPNQNEPCL
jgi:hypothetical protein